MSTENNEVKVYDSAKPDLKAGLYTVKLEKQVSIAGSGSDDNWRNYFSVDSKGKATRDLALYRVAGEQFAISPTAVFSNYPGNHAQGPFQNTMPYIVLNRKMLPWIREAVFKDSKDGTNIIERRVPWLALMLLEEEDLEPTRKRSEGKEEGKQDFPTLKSTVKEFLADIDEKTYKPDYVSKEIHDDIQNKPVSYISLTKAALLRHMPHFLINDLLCHVRQVSIGDCPEHPGMEEDGDLENGEKLYSLILSNQFPDPDKDYVVHLVSLEQMGTAYTECKAHPDKYDAFEFVSLYSWQFHCDPEGEDDFENASRRLVTHKSEAGETVMDDLFMRSPLSGTRDDKLGSKGYVPKKMESIGKEHKGQKVWYRSPFVPKKVGMDESLFQGLGNTISYVRKLGDAGLDYSYAAAFDLGRLSGLSNPTFREALLSARVLFRRASKRKQVALGSSFHHTPETDDAKEMDRWDSMISLEKSGYPSQALHRLLRIKPAKATVNVLQAKNPVKEERDTVDPSFRQVSLGSIVKEHKPKEGENLLFGQLQEGSRKLEDSLMHLKENIAKGVAALELFDWVPFNHLVPDKEMLPPDSLRFFHVDPNWKRAFLEGALSIGIHSKMDHAFHDSFVDYFIHHGQKTAASARDRIYGINSSSPVTPHPEGVSKAGFLIRSSFVSDYPGIGIIGKKQGKELPLLKCKRISSGILLGIFGDIPDEFEIREAPHGLRFGFQKELDEETRKSKTSDFTIKRGSANTSENGFDSSGQASITLTVPRLRLHLK